MTTFPRGNVTTSRRPSRSSGRGSPRSWTSPRRWGGRTRVEGIPTPADCVDGFFEAFWGRPEALLSPSVRASQSMWALLDPGVEERIIARLAADLHSGAWDTEHGHLRDQTTLNGALRLVISEPA